MSREAVKESPEWDDNVEIDRDYETRLFGYYGFSPYWV
jgi:hypothetical protein